MLGNKYTLIHSSCSKSWMKVTFFTGAFHKISKDWAKAQVEMGTK